ncbi:MAG: phosphatase PAP2 family protein [Microbacteriaceae bacterium]|nr:phosphatase PAP2 family protein [Microbacteriaceae bacterium]
MRALSRGYLYAGMFAVLGCVVLGALISRARDKAPLATDVSWLMFLRQHQSPPASTASQFLADVGGGIIGGVIVPLIIVALFGVFRRPWAAGFFAVVTLVSDESVVLLKLFFDRPRPGVDSLGAIVGSFPSGHAANAATLFVLLGLLIRRRWLYAAGAIYLPLMMLSRTYLEVHWLSDTIGGALIGLGIPLVFFGLVGPYLERERRADSPDVKRLSTREKRGFSG